MAAFLRAAARVELGHGLLLRCFGGSVGAQGNGGRFGVVIHTIHVDLSGFKLVLSGLNMVSYGFIRFHMGLT